MGVTSIATGASLNTRPDVPHVGNVDYNAATERTHHDTAIAVHTLTVHIVCTGSWSGWGRVSRSGLALAATA